MRIYIRQKENGTNGRIENLSEETPRKEKVVIHGPVTREVKGSSYSINRKISPIDEWHCWELAGVAGEGREERIRTEQQDLAFSLILLRVLVNLTVYQI